MRFSAKTEDEAQIVLLSRAATMVAKVVRGREECHLRLEPDAVVFAQSQTLGSTQQLSLRLQADDIFRSYSEEGLSPQANFICLSLDCEQLAGILRAAAAPDSAAALLRLKLCKRGSPPTPHLSFQTLCHGQGDSINTTHLLPVALCDNNIFPADHFRYPAPPPDPDAIAVIPNAKAIHRLITSLKPMANSLVTIRVKTHRDGHLHHQGRHLHPDFLPRHPSATRRLQNREPPASVSDVRVLAAFLTHFTNIGYEAHSSLHLRSLYTPPPSSVSRLNNSPKSPAIPWQP